MFTASFITETKLTHDRRLGAFVENGLKLD